MPVKLQSNVTYLQGLVRACGGALVFALPLLMTAEMWLLGSVTMDRLRLLVFLSASLPLLLGLSYYSGFEPTFCLQDEILDALAAFGVGFVVSAIALLVLGAITADSTIPKVVAMVALCTVPAAIGALLAGKQFGQRDIEDQSERRNIGYAGKLFLMTVGSVFLAFNIAPTDEVALISYSIGPIRTLALMVASILVLHLFVYALGFRGEDDRRQGGPHGRLLLMYTIPGYAIALTVGAFCLWTFGRLDDVAAHEAVTMIAVLGFPGALGAATARLVI